MRIGTKGTARDGQHGVITEVYTNAVRFLSDTGAHFTILLGEFTPDSAKRAERATIAKRAAKFFSGIGANDGFHFGERRTRKGRRTGEWFLKRIPGYLGVPDAEPQLDVEVA